jgi:UDP-N-acetylglucosamine 2-epimerase
MKLLTILGARPQFIKAAVVSRCIRDYQLNISEDILHTGQHYDYSMSQIFFDEMDIPKPTINLQIGTGDHGAATGKMLEGIEYEIKKRKPDCVLVYGDTNSTLAGALAAAKLQIPVAHIEAGERSYNRQMPEEINRVVTDHVSSFLFCCSDSSKNRLHNEGIKKNVFVVGDVMLDAFLTYLSKSTWPKKLNHQLNPFVLATLHRAQNTDNPTRLQSILSAFSDIDVQVVFPIHPRTHKSIVENKINIASNIHIIEPVSYFEMLQLLKECEYVLTDSGGLQKEAYYAGKKCITLREETEWIELVEVGMNKVTGVNSDDILSSIPWAKTSEKITNPIYGDGSAGKKIIHSLYEIFETTYTA